MTPEAPPLGERFEVRQEPRFCVYRVGAPEPIGICVTREAADTCRAMLERNEWPWYDRNRDALPSKSATQKERDDA